MKISREELYRRVWEKPVTHIAKELDISDVGLAKACRKHAIPLPPVGYWVKLKFGKAGSRPPLPKLAVESEIEIDARRYRLAPPVKADENEPKLVVVPQPELQAEKLSRFTAATRKKLLSTKPDRHGFLECSGPELFSCRVSEGTVEYAALLLDAVEKALPEVQAKLVKGEKALEFEHDGQRVSFRLFEQHSRAEAPVQDPFYKRLGGTEYVYTFTGKLSLEITSYFDGRKKWGDGARESLSDKLGSFVQGLVDAARALKKRAQEMEAQRLRWAEEARVREERERENRALEDFRQKLLAEAKASNDSQLMLAYLLRIQERLAESDTPLQKHAHEWLQRAQRIAEQTNPELRRVRRLTAGGEPDPFSGYFGRALI
ncbi:hypothetical protein [Hydrogenophaga pseudoflava]|uniref:hypothetical protein n=1 Tax=Hydrogenophaga pseudoflava TaxID=47421 RepID=UPI0027E3E5AA|nr:hypothetical protein [Hydrogenophaga pseudoflava]MDQ7746337.1 hypothetical protein [Hydrogenophaga pseudoflava]